MFDSTVAALRISAKLAETEQAIASAHRSLLGLTLAMVEARDLADVGSTEGQAILLRAQRSQQSILSAQSDLFRVHADLRKLNQGVRMMPDENGECPDRLAQLAPATRVA